MWNVSTTFPASFSTANLSTLDYIENHCKDQAFPLG